ncbi:MAG: undecaprenyl-phosphate alpha-N-acetylglucosaminyl 1-phosphate transferase [Acidobacteria bacterium]|nr:MAG: undecaprenyl-phosphate alpha-N-acetylglucosaminyl 1-phosphate transferase [Acidobacteriota bacterium]
MRYAVAFILSFVFALYWTPLMRKAALQLGIVDRPDGLLKNHRDPVPYLGGIAVFMAFLFSVGMFTDFGQETLGLLLSGSIALMVGLLDDFGAMTPSQKLLGQTLAALVLIKSGIYIKLEFLPIWLAIPLTVLWILAVTNALNIIDILDGLAAGISVIAALSIAIANFMAGRYAVAFLSLVLAGAILGFLRHNFYPAKIYLGDAGSLFIGFMLAALSMNAGYTRANLLAVLSPVLILGIPLFDLTLVMWIRWRNGIPMMKGSPDHFALRLRRLLSVRETAVTAYIIGALLSGIALLISQISLEWALATMGGTLSAACLSAYLLMKVDMRS